MENSRKIIRTRFAPSPTGHPHLGTARTALFNWIFTRQHSGVFILRIEDTDKERSRKEYEVEVIEALHWLGLDWDEGPMPNGKENGAYGPYRQSERTRIYKKYLERLLEEKKAYYCYCRKENLEAERESLMTQGLPPKYGGHCRNLEHPPSGTSPTSIRFKTPETEVEFKDMIRGTVRFDAGLFGDMVIAKDTDTPLYNFAVVVDDYEMKITHIIRGEEHLPNTPKQILLQHALGIASPEYGHLPLILASDRSKLAKRHIESSLLGYREEGCLPNALLNFLALLGWHPEGDEEVMVPNELVEKFNIKKVQKGGAVFNQEKLEWLNAQHIKKLSDDEILDRLESYATTQKELFEDRAFAKKIIHVERDRMKLLKDFAELGAFFFKLPEYESSLLIWDRESPQKIYRNLQESYALLKELNAERFTKTHIMDALRELLEKEGNGAVLWPLRVAVSGRTASPDPYDILEILGKEETLKRLTRAIEKIQHDAR